MQYTTDGVPQIGSLNPYVRVEGETFNAQIGIETEVCSAGGMHLTSIANGDWVKLKGVDFGAKGAKRFNALVASDTVGGQIEIRIDNPDGKPIATCNINNTGGAQKWKKFQRKSRK